MKISYAFFFCLGFIFAICICYIVFWYTSINVLENINVEKIVIDINETKIVDRAYELANISRSS